jgi:soluble lytic murein transglycosylase-like protein
VSAIPQAIVSAANAQGVPPQLALEVAIQESGLNQSAVSSAGARGIFQLMPATAAMLGVNPDDPGQNIHGGVAYLGMMLQQFGDPAMALGAYNWGPSAVSSAVAAWGQNWLQHAPAETQNYVQRILGAIGSEYTVTDTSLPPTSVSITSVLTWIAIGVAIIIGWNTLQEVA